MPIALPPGLDPLQDPHGAAFARHLPRRAGAEMTLPQGLSCVFIVFTNRSGSSYLAELLASTGFFNGAGEDLNADVAIRECAARGLDSFPAYFAALAAEQARNGYFLVKCSPGQLAVLAWHGILERIVARSRFLLLERIDKLAQVISWSIAARTGRFTTYQPPAGGPPPYDGAGLRRDLDALVAAHANAALLFALNGIVPFHVTYESLTSQPLLVGELICRWLGHKELVCDPARIGLRRQADMLNAAWRRRFVAEQQGGAG